MIDTTIRVPPQDPEAERAVLGAILLDNAAAPIVLARGLTAAHFYARAHGVVFAAAARLVECGRPADYVTLEAELRRTGELEVAGGISALKEFVAVVPCAAEVEHYARQVVAMAALREVARVAADTLGECYDAQDGAEAICDRAERRLLDCLARRAAGRGHMLADYLREELDRLSRPPAAPGLLTGYHDLDGITGGLRPGELVILAARPSVGKSSFATCLVRNVIRRDPPVPVHMFSLEVAGQQIAQNLLAQVSEVDTQRIAMGGHGLEGERAVRRGIEELMSRPALLEDDAQVSIGAIRARARLAHMRFGTGLVVVDYLQLVEGERRGRDDNRVLEIGSISRGLKAIAKELAVPVLALSQLNRAVESRSDGKPRLSDLRESGSLEQDADQVWLLSRDTQKGDGASAELCVAKNRNGPTGMVSLVFRRACVSWGSAAHGGDPHRPLAVERLRHGVEW